jgi:hypothetical protein
MTTSRASCTACFGNTTSSSPSMTSVGAPSRAEGRRELLEHCLGVVSHRFERQRPIDIGGVTVSLLLGCDRVIISESTAPNYGTDSRRSPPATRATGEYRRAARSRCAV